MFRYYVLPTLVTLMLAVNAGCTHEPPVIANWHKAKLEMTRTQIKELLGEPTRNTAPIRIECDDNDSEATLAVAGGLAGMLFETLDEWWEYAPPHYERRIGSQEEEQRRRAELAKKLETLSEGESAELGEELAEAIFSGPSDEAFVVYFDCQGHVKGLRAPTAGPYANCPSFGDCPSSGAEARLVPAAE